MVNNLFEKLLNLNLLHFITPQILSDIKSIQEFKNI